MEFLKVILFSLLVAVPIHSAPAEDQEESNTDALKNRDRLGYDSLDAVNPPRDCEEVQKISTSPLASGVYLIQPLGFTEAFGVYCDFETDGGGWTVIQRRVDASVDFDRVWSEYKEGFGNLMTNFWLGNDQISYLTKQEDYELRIELLGPTGSHKYAKYDYFQVEDEDHYYKLLLGTYSGTAGGASLDSHRDMYFTTRDVDHDQNGGENCATIHGYGGWWYRWCYQVNLNADYITNENGRSIKWLNFPGGGQPLKFTEMKVRAI